MCVEELPRGALSRARRRARRIGRAFGGVREIDVALELVASMPDERLPAAGAGRLRHHLTEERASRRRRLLARVSATQLRKFSRDAADLLRSLDARAVDRRLGRSARRPDPAPRGARAGRGRRGGFALCVRTGSRGSDCGQEAALRPGDRRGGQRHRDGSVDRPAQVRAGHAGPPPRPGGGAEPHPGDADPPRAPAGVGGAARAAPRGPRRRLLPAARGLRGGAAGAPRAVREGGGGRRAAAPVAGGRRRRPDAEDVDRDGSRRARQPAVRTTRVSQAGRSRAGASRRPRPRESARSSSASRPPGSPRRRRPRRPWRRR